MQNELLISHPRAKESNVVRDASSPRPWGAMMAAWSPAKIIHSLWIHVTSNSLVHESSNHQRSLLRLRQRADGLASFERIDNRTACPEGRGITAAFLSCDSSILVSWWSPRGHVRSQQLFTFLCEGPKSLNPTANCLYAFIYSDFSAESPLWSRHEKEAPLLAQKALDFFQSTAVTFHPRHSLSQAKQTEHSVPR